MVPTVPLVKAPDAPRIPKRIETERAIGDGTRTKGVVFGTFGSGGGLSSFFGIIWSVCVGLVVVTGLATGNAGPTTTVNVGPTNASETDRQRNRKRKGN